MVSLIPKDSLAVQKIVISKEIAGQRLDNFLFSYLKGVPRTRIYRIIRKGEVRINQGRTKPDYKLNAEDIVRIPPIRYTEKNNDITVPKSSKSLLQQILYEDDEVIILNKPNGWAVHGGSGIQLGVIETLRVLLKKDSLELVHRLDKETSGCLLIAKGKTSLRFLHEQFRTNAIEKVYWTLVKGSWQGRSLVSLPLLKNQLKSGERIVRVTKGGQRAETAFRILKRFKETTLLEARLLTGRTHQIRVHTAAEGFPVVGDEKYGDKEFNKKLKTQKGYNRLCLHAKRLNLTLPSTTQRITIEAPIDESWATLL
jgi:23S rRNA pseudouridine955/2504/2580 synthase